MTAYDNDIRAMHTVAKLAMASTPNAHSKAGIIVGRRMEQCSECLTQALSALERARALLRKAEFVTTPYLQQNPRNWPRDYELLRELHAAAAAELRIQLDDRLNHWGDERKGKTRK